MELVARNQPQCRSGGDLELGACTKVAVSSGALCVLNLKVRDLLLHYLQPTDEASTKPVERRLGHRRNRRSSVRRKRHGDP